MGVGLAGQTLVLAAFAASIVALAAPIAGLVAKDTRPIAMGRRALYAAAALVGAATLLLLIALYSRDFSIAYVAGHTSRSTPLNYTFTALWAGMEGSLLFWTVLSGGFAASAVFVQSRRRPEFVPVANAVLGGVLAFFTGLLAFGANPFLMSRSIPADGAGLNPLLQSPFMTIHPILLYLGFTGFLVPFAFAISALVSGRLDQRWFTSTRRWTVGAWCFLSVGIVLGAAWAYHELGWGGYWAWDPVENASLLPWLTATAFLHSVLIQERRGMLKVWNVALILGTYSLAIFGTFLTRSGLLTSVHTFSESPVGKSFLPVLALIVLGSFTLLGLRADRLRGERKLDSLVSRESMFLFNNLLFVAIAFTVLWGTIYPLIVEAVTGDRISVGPPFFNSVIVPLGLALLALTGIGPLVAWRKASTESLKRAFPIPLIAGSAVVLALGASGVLSPGALLAFGLAAFVFTGTVTEFVTAAKTHSSISGKGIVAGLRTAVGRNRRRYGGYIVHLGVVLIFIGLAGGAFRQSWSGVVSVGDSFQIGNYAVTYASSDRYETEERLVFATEMHVLKKGRQVGTLRPQRNLHIAQQQPQSEIGLRTTPVEDLYIAVTQVQSDGTASVRAWVNPLVMWIWIGGVVMTFGMAVIFSARSATSRGDQKVESNEKRERVGAPV